MTTTWTAGVVGHGVNAPEPPEVAARTARWAEAVATCAEKGHPGATYNTALDRTWCPCGAVQRDGDRDVHGHRLCCGDGTGVGGEGT